MDAEHTETDPGLGGSESESQGDRPDLVEGAEVERDNPPATIEPLEDPGLVEGGGPAVSDPAPRVSPEGDGSVVEANDESADGSSEGPSAEAQTSAESVEDDPEEVNPAADPGPLEHAPIAASEDGGAGQDPSGDEEVPTSDSTSVDLPSDRFKEEGGDEGEDRDEDEVEDEQLSLERFSLADARDLERSADPSAGDVREAEDTYPDEAGEPLDTASDRAARFDPSTLAKLESVFVPSDSFSKTIKRLEELQRTVVVYGPQHAGKLTTAINLGLKWALNHGGFSENPEVYVYSHRALEEQGLWALTAGRLQDKEVDGRPRVFIVTDAFDDDRRLPSRISPQLDRIQGDLQVHTGLCVLTTELRLTELEELRVGKVNAQLSSMKLVFDSHLVWFTSPRAVVTINEEVADAAKGLWSDLQSCFSYPAQVDGFCERLGALATDDVEAIRAAAEQAGRMGRESARSWFNGLQRNGQLYAMLLSLLGEADRNTLDLLYLDAVQHLRGEGLTEYKDARSVGLDDIVGLLQIETGVDRIAFDNRGHEREVSSQIRNYRHLLWGIASLFQDRIQRYKDPAFWPLRRALGDALGRLGIHDKESLGPLLDELAIDDHGGVVAAAGWALDQLHRSEDRNVRSWALERIEDWADAENPKLRRAAPACIWRLHSGLVSRAEAVGDVDSDRHGGPSRKRLLATLRKLGLEAFGGRYYNHAYQLAREGGATGGHAKKRARTLHYRWAMWTVNGVVYALEKIALADASAALEALDGWLAEKDGTDLHLLAHLAVAKIFEAASRSSFVDFRGRDLLAPLFDLIEPVLRSSRLPYGATSSSSHPLQDPRTQSAMRMFESLADGLDGHSHSSELRCKMLAIANRLAPETASRLRYWLLSWVHRPEPSVRELAFEVIGRTLLLTGLPVEPRRGLARCLVAIDGSNAAKSAGRGERLGLRTAALLAPWIDTNLAVLGAPELRAEMPISRGHEITSIRSVYSRPRLLGPLLTREERKGPDPVLVVVVTCGHVIDLDDLVEAGWGDRILGLWAGDPDEMPGDGGTWVAMPENGWLRMAALDEELLSHAARRLSRAVGVTDGSVGNVAEQALAWATELSEALKGRPDDSEAIRRFVADLARVARRESVGTEAFLHLGQQAPEATVASTAMGRCLLWRWGEEPPSNEDQGRQAILGIRRLLKLDSETATRALRTALGWTEDETWGRDLLGSGGRPEALELDRLPTEIRTAIARNLEEWLAAEPDWLSPVAQRVAERWVGFLRLQEMGVATLSETPTLVIVLDLGLTGSQRHLTLRIAMSLSEKLENLEISHATFPLGSHRPISMAELDFERASAPRRGERRARLIGPILSRLRPADTRMLLVVSGDAVVDAEDWRGSAWTGKAVVLPVADRGLIAGYPTLRVPFRNGDLDSDALWRQIYLQVRDDR